MGTAYDYSTSLDTDILQLAGAQYKAIVTLARVIPPSLSARLGSRTGRRYER